MEHCNTILP